MTTPSDEPQHQHPCRCETCNKGEFEGNGSVRCEGDYLPPNYVSLIEKRGCASHSANTVAQAPRKCYDVNVCAFCTDASCRCNGCVSPTKAQAQIDAVVKELEETLEHSKEKLYGFTAEEAGWVGGYESGLTEAIALLKEGVGK